MQSENQLKLYEDENKMTLVNKDSIKNHSKSLI